MAQTSKIIILNSKDAIKEAKEIQKFLLEHRIESLTFQEAMEKAGPGTPIITIHSDMVEFSKVVIVVASPGLFKDDFKVRICEIAIFTHKFFPVLKGFQDTKLPLWFSMYQSVNFNNKSFRDPWEWLLADVQKYLAK